MVRRCLCLLLFMGAPVVLASLCWISTAPIVVRAAPQTLPGTWHVLYAAPGDANYSFGPKFGDFNNLSVAGSEPGATFVVTYNGFSAEAQAAFQAAVNIWANTISSPFPIRINATFTSLDSGVLGSTRASVLCLTNSGAPNTYYVMALAHKIDGNSSCGTGLVSHEMEASFNSNFANWDFGTGGIGVSGRYNFMTVVLHEIAHGLGVTGSFTSQGGVARLNSLPFIYDRFSISGDGRHLLEFPQPSTDLHAQLIADNTYLNGTSSTAANGGQNVKLETHHFTEFYRVTSDNGWRQGSSYSHIDDIHYTATPNGLMTWALGTNEVYTDPGPIVKGMLRDLGWTLAGSGPPEIVSPAPGSELTSTTVTFHGAHASGDILHWLTIGTEPGALNVFSGEMPDHTVTVSGLPARGPIWVRYWTLFAEGWESRDHAYMMNAGTSSAPSIVSPEPGSTITNSTATFTGAHLPSDSFHWLTVGHMPGGEDFWSQGMSEGESMVVSGLPASGTIWVRYWTLSDGEWNFQDHTYTMAVAAVAPAPAPAPPILWPETGTTLESTTVRFYGGHTIYDFQHWLQVGDTQGSGNIADHDLGHPDVFDVSGLPAHGVVWLRYWTKFDDGWDFADHYYYMNVP